MIQKINIGPCGGDNESPKTKLNYYYYYWALKINGSERNIFRCYLIGQEYCPRALKTVA